MKFNCKRVKQVNTQCALILVLNLLFKLRLSSLSRMDMPHLTEDEMAEVKKNALESLRPYLVEKLLAERHYDYLRSKKILTREDTEEINCRSTRGKRAGKLLDLIAENPRGLDTLIESIQRCQTLNFIIAKITDEVQRCKNEKIEALRAGVSNSTSKDTSGATNNLSKADFYDYDKCSTVCLHPDGERSPASSVMSSSMNLSFAVNQQRGQDCMSVSGVASLTTSSSLPRPGDPGAPPLPNDITVEDQDAEAGACGSTGSSGDANFLPLRSRSLNLSVDNAL
ncbi:B-cell lymphoma/leukemia 10 isoform X2 [Neoarius graeffei]|uniref:B-cell lymphoma/leukemia 10 isoform X2 n=1 Tax=Neoarius graeffei TaxID=443677 RepID=UPI00298C9B76|nr:B-cell lymphoma/leukemia 10 isoform X2 [Neoarius graeffei]